jgi:zinc transporter ZupT
MSIREQSQNKFHEPFQASLMLGVLNLASETILLLPAVSEREVSFVSTSSSASSQSS